MPFQLHPWPKNNKAALSSTANGKSKLTRALLMYEFSEAPMHEIEKATGVSENTIRRATEFRRGKKDV